MEQKRRMEQGCVGWAVWGGRSRWNRGPGEPPQGCLMKHVSVLSPGVQGEAFSHQFPPLLVKGALWYLGVCMPGEH